MGDAETVIADCSARQPGPLFILVAEVVVVVLRCAYPKPNNTNNINNDHDNNNSNDDNIIGTGNEFNPNDSPAKRSYC